MSSVAEVKAAMTGVTQDIAEKQGHLSFLQEELRMIADRAAGILDGAGQESATVIPARIRGAIEDLGAVVASLSVVVDEINGFNSSI